MFQSQHMDLLNSYFKLQFLLSHFSECVILTTRIRPKKSACPLTKVLKLPKTHLLDFLDNNAPNISTSISGRKLVLQALTLDLPGEHVPGNSKSWQGQRPCAQPCSVRQRLQILAGHMLAFRVKNSGSVEKH